MIVALIFAFRFAIFGAFEAFGWWQHRRNDAIARRPKDRVAKGRRS